MTDPSDAAGSPGTSNCRPSLAQGTAGLAVRTLSSPPPPPGRLASLRSRDLTLGGFKKVAVLLASLVTLIVAHPLERKL